MPKIGLYARKSVEDGGRCSRKLKVLDKSAVERLLEAIVESEMYTFSQMVKRGLRDAKARRAKKK